MKAEREAHFNKTIMMEREIHGTNISSINTEDILEGDDIFWTNAKKQERFIQHHKLMKKVDGHERSKSAKKG